MAKPPKVSVIIPAYNEATYIDRLLHALTNQNYKDFEVIVSDAQSKDGTREVVESFKNKLDIKFFEAAPKGPAFGRNQGAKLARGDWLLFLDADVDVDDHEFIEKLINYTADKDWNTSSAKMTARGKAARQYSMLFGYQKLLQRTKKPVASGYCIFTRKSIFQKKGGFNESILFGEDYEYVSKTGKDGKFGFVETTEYYVDPRRNQEHGLKLAWQGTMNEVYRLLFGYGKLEKQPIKYEFGKHKPRGIRESEAGWRSNKLMIQFAEYMVGGGVWFWGGLGVFALCFDVFHWRWWVSKALADIFGWSANYGIQRYWAFYSSKLAGQNQQVIFRYVLINSIDFIFDYAIVWAFVHNDITPYVGFFASAAFTTVWDYLWYRFWVFVPSGAKRV